MREPISKTKRKQEMHRLQAWGEKLAMCKEHVWDELALDERTRQAMIEYRRLSREAKRRQGQYIGKLLHSFDPDFFEGFFADQEVKQKHRNALAARLPELFTKLLSGSFSLADLQELLPKLQTEECENLLQQAREEPNREFPAQGARQKKLWDTMVNALPEAK